jgi:hypothetical protein
MEQTQVELLLDTGESGDKLTSLRHFRKTVRSLNNTNFHSFKRETEIELKKFFFFRSTDYCQRGYKTFSAFSAKSWRV